MPASYRKEIAVFGGGCFWCVEAVFKTLRGISSVEPGYAGGVTENPTYQQVSSGGTGHAEVVRIEFDPAQIKFSDLMTVFFVSHDPTSINRQGNDIGDQYRSVIFYTNPEQQKQATVFIAELNASSVDGDRVVTQVVPLEEYYPAEQRHKDYFANHEDEAYCQLVINPKLEKVKTEFAELLKKENENVKVA